MYPTNTYYIIAKLTIYAQSHAENNDVLVDIAMRMLYCLYMPSLFYY